MVTLATEAHPTFTYPRFLLGGTRRTAGEARHRSADGRRETVRVPRHVAPGTGDQDDHATRNRRAENAPALVELGESGAALATAGTLSPGTLRALRPERRSNHHLDVARAHTHAGHTAKATAALLDAEQVAPAELRCRPLARAVVGDLLRRSTGGTPGLLGDLARRIGVPT